MTSRIRKPAVLRNPTRVQLIERKLTRLGEEIGMLEKHAKAAADDSMPAGFKDSIPQLSARLLAVQRSLRFQTAPPDIGNDAWTYVCKWLTHREIGRLALCCTDLLMVARYAVRVVSVRFRDVRPSRSPNILLYPNARILIDYHYSLPWVGIPENFRAVEADFLHNSAEQLADHIPDFEHKLDFVYRCSQVIPRNVRSLYIRTLPLPDPRAINASRAVVMLRAGQVLDNTVFQASEEVVLYNIGLNYFDNGWFCQHTIAKRIIVREEDNDAVGKRFLPIPVDQLSNAARAASAVVKHKITVQVMPIKNMRPFLHLDEWNEVPSCYFDLD